MDKFKKYLNMIKIPSRRRIFYAWQIFTKKEKIIVIGLLLAIATSGLIWIFSNYFKSTVAGPGYGGEYSEAMLGEPQYINPILAQTNDVDRDLSVLLFSGLMKYNSSGEIIPDLAERYEISEDGKTYTFYLRENLKWHDGVEIKADDIVFTITVIQGAEYHSPIRVNWQGVKVEQVDDYTVKFILNNVYAPFLENTTVGIIPRHIWQDISFQNFPLAEFNLKPIGSGPYKFKKLQKDKLGKIISVELSSFEDYYFGEPYISRLKFVFYNAPEMMIQAYNNNLAQGLNFLSSRDRARIKNNANIYSLKLPRYFAVFFNQNQSEPLSDKTVRLALNYAADKKKIIDEILGGDAEVVDSPILPGLLGYDSGVKIYDFSPEYAANILEEAGWKDIDGDGFREKESKKSGVDPVALEVTLATTNWPELLDVAESLQKDWEQIGVKINIDARNIGEIQYDYIKPRKYQSLLFGQVLSYLPDPFSFWHSSQKKDPGLNLALYDNRKVDQLLEEARQTLKEEERVEKYREFQKILIEDVPALFLYSPYYLYVVSEKVKGIDVENVVVPSQRFSEVYKWYVKTNRVKKTE